MLCECGGNTRVAETRGAYRRRECLICLQRFWTEEARMTTSPVIPQSPERVKAKNERRAEKGKMSTVKVIASPVVQVALAPRVKTAREKIEDLRDDKKYEAATDYFVD